MTRLYRALIRPNVNGGNIPVEIYANNANQAKDLIRQLPYFHSFVTSVKVINETVNDNEFDFDDIEV